MPQKWGIIEGNDAVGRTHSHAEEMNCVEAA